MLDHIPAIYRDGAFHPIGPCDLPNESRVILSVQEPSVQKSPQPDPEKQRQILKRAVERMRNNPLPLDTPPMTREWMHERG